MNRRGFTLLELMVAISILAVIVTIIYTSFDTIVRASEVARAVAEKTRLRQFLLKSLDAVIPAVHADAPLLIQSYQFLGEDEAGPAGPGDRLQFCAAAPLLGGRALPGAAKLITLELVDQNALEGGAVTGVQTEITWSDTPDIALQYTEEPLTVEMNLGGEDMISEEKMEQEDYASWSVPVATFDVAYFDGEEWRDSWDSMNEGLLPWALRIRINFLKTEQEADAESAAGINALEEPDFEMTYVLPLGAGASDTFIDPNPAVSEQMNGDLFEKKESQ